MRIRGCPLSRREDCFLFVGLLIGEAYLWCVLKKHIIH